MEEATDIAYNNAIEELRAKEYPMLRGKSTVKADGMHTHCDQIQPTLIMLVPHPMPNR